MENWDYLQHMWFPDSAIYSPLKEVGMSLGVYPFILIAALFNL